MENETFNLYKKLKIDDYSKHQYKKLQKDIDKLPTRILKDKFGKIPKKNVAATYKASDEYKETYDNEVEKLNNLTSSLISNYEKDFDKNFDYKYKDEFSLLENSIEKLKDSEEFNLKDILRDARYEIISNFQDEHTLDDILEEHKDNIKSLILDDIKEYLSSEIIYITHFDEKSYWGYSDKLSIKYLDYFLESFKKNFWCSLDENLDYDYLYDNDCEEGRPLITGYLLQLPEIMDLEEKLKKLQYSYVNVIEDFVTETFETSDILCEVRKELTDDFILDTLLLNKEYSKMVLEYRIKKEEDAKLYKNLISSIPKKYIDFYPLARKMKRKFFLHIGPTNSGKTYQSIQALEKADRGIYLSPLRLLAYEQFDRLNKDGVYCSLVTGEEEIIVPEATHQSSTIEMLDITKEYDVAVIDEAQLIGDSERGGAWTKAILGVLAREIHICAAPEAEDILISLINSCRDDVEVTYHKRDTELIMEGSNFSFPEDVREKDAIIVFSKKDVHSVAAELQKNNIKCSIVYSALPYDVRHKEAEKFNLGETEVVVSTDAIGMGLNMPIRRIIFLQNYKFDGKEVRTLYPSEVKQIAGRAGRRGMFDKGLVNTPFEKKKLRRLLEAPNEKIKEAYIGFPESLIGLDAKLSDIIKKWVEIETAPKFNKILGEREIYLAEMLEKECDNKEFIYEFVTIPFDEEREELLDLWLKLFRAEKKGTPLKLENIGIYCFDEIESSDELHMVESEYSKLDLLYQYNRKFSHTEELPKIMEKKEEFSNLMMKFLGTQNLSGRHCRYCGKPLSWNYPYGMCEKCYKKGKYRYNY